MRAVLLAFLCLTSSVLSSRTPQNIGESSDINNSELLIDLDSEDNNFEADEEVVEVSSGGQHHPGHFFEFDPFDTEGTQDTFYQRMMKHLQVQSYLMAYSRHDSMLKEAYNTQVVQALPPFISCPINPVGLSSEIPSKKTNVISKTYIVGDFKCSKNYKSGLIHCINQYLSLYIGSHGLKLHHRASILESSLSIALDPVSSKSTMKNVGNNPFVVVRFTYSKELERYIPVISSDVNFEMGFTYKSGDVLAVVPRLEIYNLVNFYATKLPSMEVLKGFSDAMFAHMAVKMGVVLFIQ